MTVMTVNCTLRYMLSCALLPFPHAAEQTMGMPALRRRWTSDDVRDLIDESRAWPRYELIDGELIVTPSPGNPHQLFLSELHLAIAPYVDREALGLTYFSPADLQLREETITQPDLFVVSAEPGTDDTVKDWSYIKGLLLAVEVISPSSVRTDRVTKRDFYMESNVAEYWIVDVDARLVERWTPDRETPLVDRGVLTWTPRDAQRSLIIDLPPLFDRVRERARWVLK